MEFILMVLGIILQGFVLKVLWLWFAVPVFKLPIISIPQALGLALIASLLTHQNRERLEKEKELAYVFVSPIVALVMGLILRLMM